MTQEPALIIACPPAKTLVEGILSSLYTLDATTAVTTCEATFKHFPNSEEDVEILASIRGRHVFVVQNPCIFEERSVDNAFMQFKLTCDALSRGSASGITGVLLPYPYQRQERTGGRRAAISASLVARETVASMGSVPERRLLGLDLHAEPIEGFVDIPFDTLGTHTEFAPIIASAGYNTVVAPDVGGTKRSEPLFALLEKYFALINPRIKVKMALVYKRRKPVKEDATPAGGTSSSNQVRQSTTESLWITGGDEVRGSNALIHDDVLTTASTVIGAAKKCRELGANKVALAITYAECNGCDWKTLGSTKVFDEVFITDALPLSRLPQPLPNHWRVISIAPLLAAAIMEIIDCGSVSSLEDRRFPLPSN